MKMIVANEKLICMAIRIEFFRIVLPVKQGVLYTGNRPVNYEMIWDDGTICSPDGCMNLMDVTDMHLRCKSLGLECGKDYFVAQEYALYSGADLPKWLRLYEGIAWMCNRPLGDKPLQFPCYIGGLYFKNERQYEILGTHLETLDKLWDDYLLHTDGKDYVKDVHSLKRSEGKGGELCDLVMPSLPCICASQQVRDDIKTIIYQSKAYDWGILK